MRQIITLIRTQFRPLLIEYNDGTCLTAIGAGVKVDFATVFKRIQKSKFILRVTLISPRVDKCDS
jgi:hypothetical protein